MSTSEPRHPDDAPGSGPGEDYPGGSGEPPRYPQAPPVQADEMAGGSNESVAQPASMRLAVRLMLAGAAVSLVSLVVSLVTLGSLKSQVRDQLEQRGQQVSQSTLDSAYGFAIGFVVVAGLISVGLWLWMAWKNGQGRGWARIVATVLAVFNLPSTLFAVASGNATPTASILSVINLILAIVIVVLLWRKESSAFYAAT